jgi:hypothetical protein
MSMVSNLVSYLSDFLPSDDTFMVWVCSRDELEKIQKHLSCTQPNIRFMMEIEKLNSLPLIVLLVKRKLDSLLGPAVYRKPTHVDIYLLIRNHHYPSQKLAVLSTLV